MNNYFIMSKEDNFAMLVDSMNDTINMALYKCHIPPRDYDDFRSYALEGLWISYMLLEEKKIPEKDFKAVAFIVMKRKIIDEIRRRSRRDIALVEDYENLKLFEAKEFNIELIDFLESIKNVLTNEQREIFKLLLQNKNVKEICLLLAISKSKCYNLISEIKEKSFELLYNKE